MNSLRLIATGALAVSLSWSEPTPSKTVKLPPDARARLIRLVQRRFDLPSNMQLNVTEVDGTPEFNRVAVFSSTPGHPFEKVLYLTSGNTSGNRAVMERVGEMSVPTERSELAEAIEASGRLARDQSPRVGNASAKLTVVVFADLECGYCREAEGALRDRVANDKDVQLVFKHHPLPSHPWARSAALAGICLDQQNDGAFWKFTNFVYEHQGEINTSNLGAKIEDFAQDNAGLVDGDQLRACLASMVPENILLRDENAGDFLGVKATPTFFINGRRVVGMGEPAEFLRFLDQLESAVTTAVTTKEAP